MGQRRYGQAGLGWTEDPGLGDQVGEGRPSGKALSCEPAASLESKCLQWPSPGWMCPLASGERGSPNVSPGAPKGSLSGTK